MVDELQARRSVKRAKQGLESAAKEVLWQVQNKVWTVLDYPDWPTMREAEYDGPAVIVPTAMRPELSVGLIHQGLSQQEVADTLGVSRGTVHNDLNGNSDNESLVRVNSRGQVRPIRYRTRKPPVKDTTTVHHLDRRWAMEVQRVSASIPFDTLTDDQLTDALGAAQFLYELLRGERITRERKRA